jgi:hypothetical protein
MVEAMAEAFDAACNEAGATLSREVIADRIIAAARLGERNPSRLQEAALRRK